MFAATLRLVLMPLLTVISSSAAQAALQVPLTGSGRLDNAPDSLNLSGLSPINQSLSASHSLARATASIDDTSTHISLRTSTDSNGSAPSSQFHYTIQVPQTVQYSLIVSRSLNQSGGFMEWGLEKNAGSMDVAGEWWPGGGVFSGTLTYSGILDPGTYHARGGVQVWPEGVDRSWDGRFTLDLTLSPLPEPSTGLLLLGGAAFGLLRRQSRQGVLA